MTGSSLRVAVGAGLMVWLGMTLLLSSLRSFSRPTLLERLRPFGPGGSTPDAAGGMLSIESFRDVLRPIVQHVGDRVSATFGVVEPLSLRLRRIHSSIDSGAYRDRQLSVAGLALIAAAIVAAAAGPPPAASAFMVSAAPLLTFLLVEQRLARRSQLWQRTLAAELPVVAEQLAMLLNAGYSLGASLSRLASRGHGCAFQDLKLVVNRTRQGVTEVAALREWAEVAQVEAVHRLVAVLALSSETTELGRLVSAEARQARRDLHRNTIEVIERRGQQVWVPVTVATLIPGVILLAVPFLAALRLFSST